MRFRKYLLAPWAAISFYAVASMFTGAAGIGAYKELLSEKQKIDENLEMLKSRNRELEGTVDGLMYDSEAVKIRARELGYGDDTEHFLRIVGLPGVRYREISPGTVKIALKPEYIPDTSLRMTAIFVGLGVFLLFFIKDVLFSAYGDSSPKMGRRINGKIHSQTNEFTGFSATRQGHSYPDLGR